MTGIEIDVWRHPTQYLIVALALWFPFQFKILPLIIKIFWAYLLAQSAWITFNPDFHSAGIDMVSDYVRLGGAHAFIICTIIPLLLLKSK